MACRTHGSAVGLLRELEGTLWELIPSHTKNKKAMLSQGNRAMPL